MNDQTACSNCTCPLNYDCEKFKLFFEGKYSFVEEFSHNNDNSCDHRKEDIQTTVSIASSQKSLF
ncbi:hypothetical protein [Sulfurimonas sp.]|uniref:hypothetical protein n=1 Tax=Sulfurimonas sp. TaxID=2022749 RepID=UPI00356992C5